MRIAISCSTASSEAAFAVRSSSARCTWVFSTGYSFRLRRVVYTAMMRSRPPCRSMSSGLLRVSAIVGLELGRPDVISLQLPQRLAHRVAHQGLLVLGRLLQDLPRFV